MERNSTSNPHALGSEASSSLSGLKWLTERSRYEGTHSDMLRRLDAVDAHDVVQSQDALDRGAAQEAAVAGDGDPHRSPQVGGLTQCGTRR
jgi:hypothetical protein